MANLECSECGDLVDVEARSVVLPFVCKWCQEGFPADPITGQEESTPDLDEQFELDSALIADLEKQLAEANRNVECWKNAYARTYNDFLMVESRYLAEKRKTWWERLWAYDGD